MDTHINENRLAEAITKIISDEGYTKLLTMVQIIGVLEAVKHVLATQYYSKD